MNVLMINLLAPLLSVPISLIIRNSKLRLFCNILIGCVLLYFTFILLQDFLNQRVSIFFIKKNFLPGISILLYPDVISIVFAALISILLIPATIYSHFYMEKHCKSEPILMSRFFALFAIAISSSIGVALSGNLWTLFIFYEILTVCTYPLVTFDRKAVSLKSGKTYINVLMGTSMALLMPAVIIIWQFNGGDSLIFGKAMRVEISNMLMQVTLFLMILYGCSKSALFPFSSWLPKAMTAPTPVSALLHAVAVVKAGVFSIMKVTYYAFDMYREELQVTLMAITIITIIFASMEAVHKKQLKSILAYSTIGQLSYILMIFACFGERGLAVALLYMGLHSMAKITLFFTAGAIYIKTGYKYVGEMKGLATRMPITCIIFSIAAFGIIGIPPTATIWAKYMMFSVAQSKIIFMALTIGFSTLMSVLYFLPIIYNFFFGGNKIKYDKNEPPALMLFSYGCTCAILVIMYFYPALTAKFIDFVINNQDTY